MPETIKTNLIQLRRSRVVGGKVVEDRGSKVAG